MLARTRPGTGDALRRAESWRRDLADGRWQLTSGRGAHAGGRAAWNDRTSDSWEHLMPFGPRVQDQRRPVTAGYRLRVATGSRR